MRAQRYLLWAALGAGLVAVTAGVAGVSWLAGGSAALLLVAFLLLPWAREEKP